MRRDPPVVWAHSSRVIRLAAATWRRMHCCRALSGAPACAAATSRRASPAATRHRADRHTYLPGTGGPQRGGSGPAIEVCGEMLGTNSAPRIDDGPGAPEPRLAFQSPFPGGRAVVGVRVANPRSVRRTSRGTSA